MSDASLRALAEAAGLYVDWVDADDQPRRVAPPVLRAALSALGFSAETPRGCEDGLRSLQATDDSPPLRVALTGEPVDLGYSPGASYVLHGERGERFEGRFDAHGRLPAVAMPGYYTLAYGDRTDSLAIAPPRCFGVADACAEPEPRRWGVVAQAYSVRGAWDAGIGDAGGLAGWADRIADAGGDAIALSPLHASGLHSSGFSPYSPVDRRFLDPVYAAPVRVLGEEFAVAALEEAALREEFLALQRLPLIDWRRASQAKWRWLQVLHRRFGEAPAELRQDHSAFVAARGAALEDYVRFAATDSGGGDAAAAANLQRFAQWLTARSWSVLQAHARASGMSVGLIADLAVGFDPHGSEAAAWPDAMLRGLVLGAPPDAFNAEGQVWGVTGYSPAGLRAAGYAPFIDLLRAAMRDRGGVRIDHILGLLRLWVVPEGGASRDGVYLRYPAEDLFRLLALESWRQRAIVIGEDLGVVPEGFRDRLAQRGVLGVDVLLFTRDESGDFLAPERWRRTAMATTTTHDLPTLAGWRAARDLHWRARLGGSTVRADEIAARTHDVERLQARVAASCGGRGDDIEDWMRFVSRAPSPLALLPLEDALGVEEQPNLPGTTAGHPNWQRRLPDPLPQDPLARRLRAFAQARTPKRAHA
jgi:4-alpha-glucanotransferase